jgi:hypothetical protein
MVYVGNGQQLKLDLILFLVKYGSDIRYVSRSDGESILHKALQNPSCTSDVVKLLVFLGADVNQIDYDGWSPISIYLQFATAIDHEIVRTIIKAGLFF